MTQDKHIWCIIMAGGLGSRFWPVSRTDNPKQFIDVTGVGRSMLQLTFERYERICPKQNIVIVTGKQYADRVREQLPDLLPYQVLSEPLVLSFSDSKTLGITETVCALGLLATALIIGVEKERSVDGVSGATTREPMEKKVAFVK